VRFNPGIGEGYVRKFEDNGIGSCDAGTTGVSRLGVGIDEFSGGCKMAFMTSFSKDSLYGTVAGEKSTTGWDWGIASSAGLTSSPGVSGALDIGVSI
jgi:hypothetical protein